MNRVYTNTHGAYNMLDYNRNAVNCLNLAYEQSLH